MEFTLSLSVNTKSGFVSYDVAEIEYFNCQQHFQHSLRCLRLRKGMVTEEDFDWSEDFGWLQEFKNLETLIVGRNIVENLEDCCDMIDNLRQLEKLTVHFAPLSHNDSKTIAIDAEANDDDATSSASIVSATAAATDEIKYPNIKKLQLHKYNISTINSYQDGILHIKRFNNLKDLYISFQDIDSAGDFRKIMVDDALLTYIHQTIPPYMIKVNTQQDDIYQYFDIYCN